MESVVVIVRAMGKKEVKGGKVKSKRWLGGLEPFSNRQAAKDFSPLTFPPFTRIDLIRRV
jgi:hypothetical protein